MRFQTIFTLVVATLLSSSGVMARTSCKDCCDSCAKSAPGSLEESGCLGNCGTYACNGKGC